MANEIALVIGVGAENGVGAAVARRFAREGFHVLVCGRTRENLEGVAESIRALGHEASAVVGDTTVVEGVKHYFDEAERLGGVPRVVVYNAGNNLPVPTLEIEPRFFEDLWRVCCFGGFLVGQEAARRMVPNGGGSLLYTGATASMRGKPPFVAFASGKAALRMVVQGFARDFGKQGIHVGHVVIDGIIDGEIVNTRFPGIKDHLGAGGMMQPDDIAEAYWMLHSQPPSAWSLEIDLRPDREDF
ncbi:MAG: SDR family NAD(P)-dependent oxidoreductase [bacterium]|nr:SDR family NAD(P)-dependent oxidoreductase [bacterium]